MVITYSRHQRCHWRWSEQWGGRGRSPQCLMRQSQHPPCHSMNALHSLSSSFLSSWNFEPGTLTFIWPQYTPACLLVVKSSIHRSTGEVQLKPDQCADPEVDTFLKEPTHPQTHTDTHTQTDFQFCAWPFVPPPFKDGMLERGRFRWRWWRWVGGCLCYNWTEWVLPDPNYCSSRIRFLIPLLAIEKQVNSLTAATAASHLHLCESTARPARLTQTYD